MEYLHSRHVVHFDLKCDNLLADLRDPSRPAVKIGDLGLSKQKACPPISRLIIIIITILREGFQGFLVVLGVWG